MGNNSNNFRLVLTILFAGFAVIGVLVFSDIIKIGGKNKVQEVKGTVTMWGTIRSDVMEKTLGEFNGRSEGLTIRYIRKEKETFNNELLDALASGKGPDLFLMTNDLVLDYANKIYPTLYTEYPLYSFQNNFVQAGNIFATKNGILAFPLVVDPLMMYYNQSILESNNIITPPVYWEDFVEMVPALTETNESKEILRSISALGQFVNINNAKEIIISLLMQTGNPILVERDGGFWASLDEDGDIYKDKEALADAISFYVSFTDPLNSLYSWNRALPSSVDFFAAQKSAFYFGFASEIKNIINKNPNLNFKVTAIPQPKDSQFKTTYAKVTGVAISLSSRKLELSKQVVKTIVDSDFSKILSSELSVAPAKKEFLSSIDPENPFLPIFYNSALFARSWLDPSYESTNDIFRSLVDKLTSNVLLPEDAIEDVNNRLNILITR